MATTPEPVDPDLPFKYVGGDTAIDFVNTVDWTDDGLVDERLGSYDRVTRWAEGAGVLAPVEGDALRTRAAGDPAAARAALAESLALRDLLHALFAGVVAGRVPGPVLAAFNASLGAALARRRLVDGPTGPTLGWDGWTTSLASPLWPVTLAAATLVASDERARIRICGGPRCGWLFVDRSRNGLRHWCQTGVCGARAKARRRYARVRAAR